MPDTWERMTDRERREWIAQHVCGWTPPADGLMWLNERGRERGYVPPYTTDPTAAVEMLCSLDGFIWESFWDGSTMHVRLRRTIGIQERAFETTAVDEDLLRELSTAACHAAYLANTGGE